jgi:hypothetical protein
VSHPSRIPPLTLLPHAARLHVKNNPVHDIPVYSVKEEDQREKLLLLVALFESALSEALLLSYHVMMCMTCPLVCCPSCSLLALDGA